MVNALLRWCLAAGLCAVTALGHAALAAPARPKKGKDVAPTPVAPTPAAPEAPPPPIAAPPPAEVVAPAVAQRVAVLQRQHSLNVGALGISDFGLTYVYRFAGGHSVVVEGFVDYVDDQDSGRTTGAGGQLGWRWFTNGTQHSYFVGVMGGYDVGRTSSSPTMVTANSTIVRRYELPYERWRATANFGRRWILFAGLNATARIGVGAGARTFARGKDVAANAQAQQVEDIFNFLPVSFDAEASLGWVF